MKRTIGHWFGTFIKRGKKLQPHGPAPVRLELECLEDRTLPSLSVLSINGAAPASLISNGPSVAYAVTFSAAAFGVNPTDFQLVTSGTVGTTLTQVTPSGGSVYTVSISGITGNGTLGLNLVNNGSIQDSSGGGLSNSSFTGQVYTIDTIAPLVQSIDRTNPASPNTNATSVAFTVTFSEAVTGVNAADFQVVTSGSVSTLFTQVTPVSGSTYTVAVSGITGGGTLGLNLVDNASIRDLAGNPLMPQNAPATFQAQQSFATGSVPRSVAVGDVNGDGNADLVVANRASNSVSVLLGNGNGSFQAQQTFATASCPDSVAIGDVNGDGLPDIVVANYANNSVSVLLGNGNGTFRAQQIISSIPGPYSVALGDVNGDGDLDLVVTNYTNDTVSVLLGNGKGSFQGPQLFAAGANPSSVALGDVNGDGKPDIVVANYRSNTVGVLLGNGNGTFQPQQQLATGSRPFSVTLGDVNGDGKLDILAANCTSNTVSVLLGNGNGSFQPQQQFATSYYPKSVTLGDVNGDGKPDIVVGNHSGNSVSVLLGNGNGSFQTQQTFSTSSKPFAVAVGDVNGDGKPDIVVTGSGNSAVNVLLNNNNDNFTGQVYTIRTSPYLFVNMPANLTAGIAAPVTVAAYDAAGNALTGYTGTVHFATSDTGAGSVVPADYTFVAADNGSHVFTTTLVTAGNQTVTATDSASSTLTGTATVSVNAAASKLTITAPASATEGAAFTITVAAEDNFGNIATGYAGIVSFTTTDPAAQPPVVLPGSYTFAASDQGVHLFNYGATLFTAGSQTITARDNNGLSGGATVNVGPVAVWPFVQSINRSSPVGPSTNATSVAYTVTFSEAVTGVTAADFQVVTSGSVGTLLPQVTLVSGSIYTVTVSGITGNGTLGLNLVDNGGIRDLAGSPLTSQNAPATFQAAQTFGTGGNPCCVAAADVNGDGKPDLIVANRSDGTVGVLLGNGNGTFQAQQTFATDSYPFSVALADLNGDGKLDIVTANFTNNTVCVLLGNGNGTFQAQQTFATGQVPESAVVGDVSGDGKPDIVVPNGRGTLSLLLGNGNGTFQAQQPFGPGGELIPVVLGDVNGDGKIDIVVADTNNGGGSVLLGNGNGTFQAQRTFATGTGPLSLALSDVNGDGKPDIVVDNGFSGDSVSVLLGNGNGTFQAQRIFATGIYQNSVAVGDVNGDGKPDIIVVNDSSYNTVIVPGTVSVLLGNGDGTFQAQQTFVTSGNLPSSVALADVNGDGKPDLVVANLGDNTVSLLLNSANGNFTGQVYTITAPAVTHFALTAPSSTTAGSPFTVVVTALDQSASLVPSYNGVIHFTSTDPQAALPLTATLTNGVGIIAVSFQTAGAQTITATDTATQSITGTSGPVSVSPLSVTHFALSAPAGAATGVSFQFTVTALDLFNNVATGYTGTVHFASTDGAASLPGTSTLVGGQGIFSATLKTEGNQSLSATDTALTTLTGTSNNIATVGLVVTSLTPTPTGFVAIFNKPFDPTPINLYDATNTFGPDDLLLTGPSAPQTSIHGSLIVDPSNQTITFVKTSTFTSNVNAFDPQTGLLNAGTYTVTFRSAANGYKDLLGAPLDGTASGNSVGINYTTTFVVSTTSADVVGLPDFARGPGNTVNLPNNQTGIGIPISLSAGANVTAGKFTLQYNSTLLSITGATVNSGLTGAALALDPASTPGDAVIDFSSATPLPTGPIRLGGLVATVPNAAASLYKSKAVLHFSSVQLNGGAIAVTTDDAIELVAYFGDANGDGQLSSGDAAFISRVAVGLDNNPATGVIGGFSAYPNADPALVADLATSGNVNSTDVTLINSFLAGIPRGQIPAIPTGLTITPSGPDPNLSLGGTELIPFYAPAGSTVIVPVNIDTARPDGSTGMTEAILALRFNPQLFSVTSPDVSLGTLPNDGSGWQLQTAINPQTGEIGIDLFGGTSIQTTAAGSLVVIALHTHRAALAGTAPLTWADSVNPTGARPFETTILDSQGAFVLHYGVSNPSTAPEPTAGAFAGDANESTFRQAIMAVNSEASAVDPRFALVNEIFGNQDLLHTPTSVFGQTEPLYGSDQTDSTLAAPSASDFLLAHAAVIQTDQLPGDGLTRKTAWRGRRASFAELLDEAVSGSDQAEVAGLDAFFAREVTGKGGL